jgi:hypothetical protein
LRSSTVRGGCPSLHLEEIEGAEDGSAVATLPADEIEYGQPVVVANDRFAVDHAGLDGQRLDRRRDEWKAVSQVVAVARNQAHGASLPMSQDPETVMLDFVNPAQARRRPIG